MFMVYEQSSSLYPVIIPRFHFFRGEIVFAEVTRDVLVKLLA